MQEFDLDNAIWEIPAERMKMRRPHLAPLSTQALDLLHELKVMTGSYRYVFPGRNDPNKPMSEASVNQIIKRVAMQGRLLVTIFGILFRLSSTIMILILPGLNFSWLMLIKIQLEERITMHNISLVEKE